MVIDPALDQEDDLDEYSFNKKSFEIKKKYKTTTKECEDDCNLRFNIIVPKTIVRRVKK